MICAKLEFIQEHLINGKVRFLLKVKQSQDWNQIRKKESKNKIVSIFQEYC